MQIGNLSGELYPQQEKRCAIEGLLSDEETRRPVISQLGRKMLSEGKILETDSVTQLFVFVSQADFANSEEECVNIAEIIHSYLRVNDIFPLVSKHRGKDLASRCLISLSLFYDGMRRNYQVHAAPKPEFYEVVGIKTFQEVGMNDISDNFVKWKYFLGEFFA
jgi:hypothetical protein